jgi:hypothetical protein
MEISLEMSPVFIVKMIALLKKILQVFMFFRALPNAKRNAGIFFFKNIKLKQLLLRKIKILVQDRG